jgi:uncharacterized membrane protein
MKKSLIFWNTVLMLALLSACQAYDLADEKAAEIKVNTSAPTWGNGVQEVLAQRCDACHAKEEKPFAPANVAPYKVGFSSNEKEFKEKWAALSLKTLTGQAEAMPPNYADPLSANEKKALIAYLEKAIASTNPFASCSKTSTTLTYEGNIKAIVQTNCTNCHFQGSTFGGGANLQTLADWKDHRLASFQYLVGKRPQYMPKGDTEGVFAKSADGLKVVEWLCAAKELQ